MPYKVNYKYYEKFRVITDAEDTSKDKDVIFRTDGSLNIQYLPKNRYVFNNNGDVYVLLTRREPNTIVFDNDGDVTLSISLNLTKCSILFYNRGKVTILGRQYNTNYTAGGVKLFNIGDVQISHFDTLWNNWLIKNEGDVRVDNIYYFYRNLEFKNEGNVFVQEVDRFMTNTKFKNKGNVEIRKVNDLGENCKFLNNGRVTITTQSASSIFDGTVFSNKSDVDIYSRSTSLMGRSFYANNIGDFSLLSASPINLTIDGTSKIESRGCVKMDIEHLNVPLSLKNGGDVIMNTLSSIAHPTNVIFSNGGNVMLKSLSLDSKTRCPVFNCGGNVWVNSVSSKDIGKRISYNGIIYTNEGTYFKTESYVKRNNIPLKDGNMILYKGVGRNGVASYDENPHRWTEGETCVIGYWNPYDKEIGEGKFMASYDTQIFKKLVKGDTVRYFAIEVNINDTFEYPFAKYPQLIGVRRATVLYEVDENKNRIESKNNTI